MERKAVLALAVVFLVFSAIQAAPPKDSKQGQLQLFGYKFDGPVERGLWRTGQYVSSFGKITDCHSLCIHRHGRSGGRCVQCRGYCDASTWCPQWSNAQLKKEEGSNDRWSDALVELFSVASYGMSNQNFGLKARASPLATHTVLAQRMCEMGEGYPPLDETG
uniref:Uncharacterized protein n=1 Tax=Romanomermis culicivorax TaxID=13658 RepID=A0A915I7D9_ROMCU